MENKNFSYKNTDLMLLKDQITKIIYWHKEFDYVDEWEKKFTKDHYNKIKNNIKGKYLVTEKQKYHLDRIISKYFEIKDKGYKNNNYQQYHTYKTNIFGEREYYDNNKKTYPWMKDSNIQINKPAFTDDEALNFENKIRTLEKNSALFSKLNNWEKEFILDQINRLDDRFNNKQIYLSEKQQLHICKILNKINIIKKNKNV
jgi:hypothetical protein